MIQGITKREREVTDPAQIRAGSEILIEYVDKLRALGQWPEAF